MRILSLACPLPDVHIDNHDWGNALSFFDYDAIVVDPAEAVSKMAEMLPRNGAPYITYDEIPITDGPSTGESVGLADLMRRRQDETQKLLARGGIVICFGYPDAPHTRVSGFTGAHRYYWLPAPAGKDYGPSNVQSATGTHATVTDYQHPFADYVDNHRDRVLYRAAFAEGATGFGESMRIFARSPGGAAIGVELAVGGGRIIFLPALPNGLMHSERAVIAQEIVAAIRNTLLLSAEGDPPAWLDNYPLPGIKDARSRMDEAESKLDDLEGELDEAKNEYRSIDRYRRLLWQEGKYGLDLPVRDALTLLGFVSYTGPDEPATFALGNDTVLVETEASDEAVGMDPHYRLRQRMEAHINDRRERPRGIIIVNGYRHEEPNQRPAQISDALRIASESMRYCVVEAMEIFDAVRNHLEGVGDTAAFARRLVETEGMFSPETPVTASTLATDATAEKEKA